MSRTTTPYEKVLGQVQALDPDDQALLLEELASIVAQQVRGRRERSIMELEGLGAEVWEGIDAREYVRKERESWDG